MAEEMPGYAKALQAQVEAYKTEVNGIERVARTSLTHEQQLSVDNGIKEADEILKRAETSLDKAKETAAAAEPKVKTESMKAAKMFETQIKDLEDQWKTVNPSLPATTEMDQTRTDQTRTNVYLSAFELAGRTEAVVQSLKVSRLWTLIDSRTRTTLENVTRRAQTLRDEVKKHLPGTTSSSSKVKTTLKE
eukprot:GHVU01224773.1.p1 GENE.GHVU01224773.1~~GHVU01224773.1.p1  ORF type:complete len:191 (+),score=31.57 GHVU01224773.1:295-867(+)